MNYLDTLYRALIDYRKNTLDHTECRKQRAAVITADNENDRIEITRKTCIVEEDWIEAIEHGLEFIEKAIKEERQFIRSNGEVVPIEKVKRVSKDSVEHLARHSNLFTREPEEGDDIIPDQLYTVERLSDYAVYENRFLYMLLCYLRDFIAIRYEKIVELTNTYNGNMTMNKAIVESNRRIKFEIALEEEKKNDEYLREHNAAQKEIDRILTIYRAVVVYLNTPLMIEVAKTPMIKPPIMRTNVLKMNRNFKKALELYEFVTSYDKDGYMINTETRVLSPFIGVVADELSEVVETSLFLTYEHGLGIRDYFKERYEEEEQRRREEERKRFAEQIRNIARQLKTNGMKPEEYILLLEKRIRDLEKEEEELEAAKKTIESLENDIGNLRIELESAQDMVRSLGEEIVRLNKKYVDDIAALHAEYTTKINELINSHQEKILALTNEYEATIEAIHTEHAEQIQAMKEEHEQEIIALHSEHAAMVQAINTQHATEIELLNTQHQEQMDTLTAAHEEQINEMTTLHAEEVATLTASLERITEEKRLADEEHVRAMEETRTNYETQIRLINAEHARKEYMLKERISEGVEQINGLNVICATLEERKVVAEARLNALRVEHGLYSAFDDFSSRAKMNELETQYNTFRKYYKAEWKQAKKAIRKETFESIFGKKEEKPKKGKAVQEPIKAEPTQTAETSPETPIETETVTVTETEQTPTPIPVTETTQVEETAVAEITEGVEETTVTEETTVAEETKSEEVAEVAETPALEEVPVAEENVPEENVETVEPLFAEETPIEEAPIEEVSIAETPIEETPTEETPVEEKVDEAKEPDKTEKPKKNFWERLKIESKPKKKTDSKDKTEKKGTPLTAAARKQEEAAQSKKKGSSAKKDGEDKA